MKKSLQYILIMSIFGMQTEALFAQKGDNNALPDFSPVVGKAMFESPVINIQDLNEVEDYIGAIEDNYGVGFSWDEYKGYKKNFMYGSHEVNLGQILNQMKNKDVAIMGMALANTQGGQNYIHILKDDTKDLLLRSTGEAFARGFFSADPVTTSGLNFIVAGRGKTIQDSGIKKWFGDKFFYDYGMMVQNPYVYRESRGYRNSHGVPVGMLALNLAGGFYNTGVGNGFYSLIDSPARKNGHLNSNIIVGKEFNPEHAVFYIAAMGYKKWGADYIANGTPEFHKRVVEKIMSLGTRNNNDKLLSLNGTMAILKAKGINPSKFKISSQQFNLLIRRQIKLLKDDGLDLKVKVELATAMLPFKNEMASKIQNELTKATKENIIEKVSPSDRQRIEAHLNGGKTLRSEEVGRILSKVELKDGDIKKIETVDKKTESEHMSPPKTKAKIVEGDYVEGVAGTEQRDIVKSQDKTEKKQ